MTIRKLWGDDDIRNSEIFLRTGQYNEVVRNAPEGTTGGDSDFSKLNACTSSSQCPAGYACVGGVCTRISFSGTGGSGQYNSAGNCNQNSPYPNDPCNSGGPSSCSTTPSCENNPKNPLPEECCGKRCCSYGSLSSLTPGVNCYCGDCPPYPDQKKCSIFCSGAGSALGDPSTMGCNADNSCTICEECDFFSRQCEQKTNGPCFCEGSECDQCGKCDSNAESADFGLCYFPAGVCSSCKTCPELKCPCGESYAAKTYCNKVGPGGVGNAAGNNVTLVPDPEAACAARQCSDPSECCKGNCTTRSYCDGAPPACPEGYDCTDAGSLSGNGSNCSFRIECDGNVPDECKECVPGEEGGCGACEYCDNDGTCQKDPQCNGWYYAIGYVKTVKDWTVKNVASFICCGAGWTDCTKIPSTEVIVSTKATRQGLVDDGLPTLDLKYKEGDTSTGQQCWADACGIYTENAPFYAFFDENGIQTGFNFRVGTYVICNPQCGCASSQYTAEADTVIGFGATPSEAQQAALAQLPESQS